jgi:hypothetical protein
MLPKEGDWMLLLLGEMKLKRLAVRGHGGRAKERGSIEPSPPHHQAFEKRQQRFLLDRPIDGRRHLHDNSLVFCGVEVEVASEVEVAAPSLQTQLLLA